MGPVAFLKLRVTLANLSNIQCCGQIHTFSVAVSKSGALMIIDRLPCITENNVLQGIVSLSAKKKQILTQRISASVNDSTYPLYPP